MKKPTLLDRASAYVQQHPGCQSGVVGADLGISRKHAANVLTLLEKRGHLTSKSAYASGTSYGRRFYPADAAGPARAVARRAQSFGGPFGILVAQLVR